MMPTSFVLSSTAYTRDTKSPGVEVLYKWPLLETVKLYQSLPAIERKFITLITLRSIAPIERIPSSQV